jgi:microcystin-dependent protein
MSAPFVAEIRIFACNFAPTGWALCNGQLMPISQNTALFSLLGTYYGGDGKTTFALPNLQASAPMFWDQGPGLSDHFLGEASGVETVTLLESEMPAHPHALQASPDAGDLAAPDATRSLARTQPYIYKQPSGAAAPLPLSPSAVHVAGGGQSHNNMQPYLTLNFCIALQGIFPARP